MRISNLCLYLVSGEQFWFLLGRYRLNPDPNLDPSKVTVQQKIFNFDPIFLQIALLTSLFHGNSKLVARFDVGWVVLICIGNLRTYRQTDGQTHSSNYNIDVEGYVEVKNLHFWFNFSANSFIKSILIFFISNLCFNLVSGERFRFLLGCYRPNPTPNLNLSNVYIEWKIFIFCPIFLQIALLNSFFKADFKSVLRFSIGQTVLISICPLPMDRQTDGQTYSSNYNIDVEGYVEVKNLHFWLNLSANSFVTSIFLFSYQICT